MFLAICSFSSFLVFLYLVLSSLLRFFVCFLSLSFYYVLQFVSSSRFRTAVRRLAILKCHFGFGLI